jgi:uncharacterized protein
MTVQDDADKLFRVIERFPSAVVAYSGGVDSTVVAVAAVKALGPDRVTAITADSPSVAREELAQAERVAREAGVPWQSVATKEVEDLRYQANDGRRCYFCKSELYGVLDDWRVAHGYAVIFDGFNVDDVGDFRPGLKAGQEHHVVSPLKEAGLGKQAVRALARAWGLSNWDKPASPCLASRIPYFVPVTVERLAQVERAEAALHALGFRAVRVRHHEDVARIEVPVGELEALIRQREAVVAAVEAAGYRFVTVDLKGLTSGSLNVLIRSRSATPGSAVNA